MQESCKDVEEREGWLMSSFTSRECWDPQDAWTVVRNVCILALSVVLHKAKDEEPFGGTVPGYIEECV